MKALCSMAALCLALLMTSCSLTQQVEGGAAEKPVAKPLTRRPGNIFNTRGRKVELPEELKDKQEEKKAAEEVVTAAPAANEAPVPTEAQQDAARQLLAEAPASTSAPSPAPEPAPLPVLPVEEVAATPHFPVGGGLRLGTIAPQEEAASASDAPPPGANSVELHGLRSPKLPKGLPMNIDGKLNSKN